MLSNIDITRVLFFDIETVPATENFYDLHDTWKELWGHKAKSLLKKEEADITPEEMIEVYERAGIYSEFGKIVCISVGYMKLDEATQKYIVKLKSFHGHDEKELLIAFGKAVDGFFEKKDKPFQKMCGHNIREFDIPYICRRMVINQLELPNLLNLEGKKPWEITFVVDTLEIWKFGDNKAYCSLKLLCALFNVPSPKDDISGADVAKVYYGEKSTERIARYCEKDVFAVMQLLLKFKLNETELDFPA